MTINIEIIGNPKTLKRHRSTRAGGNLRHYDPSAADKQEFLLQALKYRPKKPIDAALAVSMVFYFPRPKSHYRTGKFSGIIKDNAPTHHTGTPDIDNLIKFVGDALNGIFWKDDKNISIITAMKYYSESPRVTIDMSAI